MSAVAEKKLGRLEVIDWAITWFGRSDAVLGWDGGNCVYRYAANPDSLTRCVIGCLIPDDMYDSELEGDSVGGLLDGHIGGFSEWYQETFDTEGVDRTWLIQLQEVHDYCAAFDAEPQRCLDGFRRALKRIKADGLVILKPVKYHV